MKISFFYCSKLLTGTGFSGSAFRGVRSSGRSGIGNARAPEAPRADLKQRTTPINNTINAPMSNNVMMAKK